jgi:hypothetical protein
MQEFHANSNPQAKVRFTITGKTAIAPTYVISPTMDALGVAGVFVAVDHSLAQSAAL